MSDPADHVPERTATVETLVAAWAATGEMITVITASEWDQPTRCSGWRVRDVAAHLAATAADVADGRPRARTPEEQVSDLRHLEPAVMAARLGEAAERLGRRLKSLTDDQWAAPIAGVRSVGEAVQTLLHDLYVHGDDVANALGRAQWDGPGIDAALATVAMRLKTRGWGPATIHIAGHPPLVFLEGAEPPVRADPHLFVMIATGRRSPDTLGFTSDVNIYQAVAESHITNQVISIDGGMHPR